MNHSKMVPARAAEKVLKKASAHAPSPAADTSPKSVRKNKLNRRCSELT